MSDTVIFMSAYKTAQSTKHQFNYCRNQDTPNAFYDHRISYIMNQNTVVTAASEIYLDLRHDNISDVTSFAHSTIYNSISFQQHDKTIKLKTMYLTNINEAQIKRNITYSNILLYVIALIGSVSSLPILEEKMNIPFNRSLLIMSLICLLGILIYSINLKRNK